TSLFLPMDGSLHLPAEIRQSAPEATMSELYGEAHRAYQDRHGTRRLADRLEALAHAELDPNDRAFIESAAHFFLSTVDERGRPSSGFRATTGTACFAPWATSRARRRSGSSSSTSNRRAGCASRAPRGWSPTRGPARRPVPCIWCT